MEKKDVEYRNMIDIASFPDCFKRGKVAKDVKAFHESLLFSFQMLQYVKTLCMRGVDPQTILEIIMATEKMNTKIDPKDFEI